MSIVPICGTCVSKEHCAVAGCNHYEKRLKLTNAEIIRSLTDEELRNFLYAFAITKDCLHESCKSFDCRSCILEWLKQETEI